jgi:hypothetical protein
MKEQVLAKKKEEDERTGKILIELRACFQLSATQSHRNTGVGPYPTAHTLRPTTTTHAPWLQCARNVGSPAAAIATARTYESTCP